MNALDYLLKPVIPARLSEAIDRVVRGHACSREQAFPALEEGDRLFLRMDDAWDFAEGNYSRIHTANGASLVQKSLQEWEARLPRGRFVRIHRSAIANVDCIERVAEWSNYSYVVHIRGLSEPLVMSRRYSAKLKRLLS